MRNRLGTFARPPIDECRELVKRFVAALGPDHPEVAICLENLGQTYLALNKPDAAEPLLRRSLQIGESTFGDDSPALVTTLDALATTLEKLGKEEESTEVAARAMRIRNQAGVKQPAPTTRP
jgi:tetratricopeptide (TPR) repeat protein